MRDSISSGMDNYDDHCDKLLIRATRDGNLVRVRDLLAKDGAHVNAKDKTGWNTVDWTPLHFACDGGRLAMAKLLVENGANAHAQTSNTEWTALHVACYYGHVDVAKMLIILQNDDDDADLNPKDKYGKTPLHLTCLQDELEPVKLLIENGADLNAKEKNGWTPLRLSCEYRKWDVAKFLIENEGTDLDAKDSNDGKAPLHLACENARLDVVQLLLNRGANVSVKTTTQGHTPLHVASERNHPEVVWFLVRRYPWLVLEHS